MNKIFQSLTISVIVLFVPGCSILESSGLINRQCRAAKKAYSEYKDAGMAIQIQENEEAVQRGLDHNNLLLECKKNPVEFFAKNQNKNIYEKNGWNCDTWDLLNPVVDWPIRDKSSEQFKFANQVILNNQQCFSPSEVVQAQNSK